MYSGSEILPLVKFFQCNNDACQNSTVLISKLRKILTISFSEYAMKLSIVRNWLLTESTRKKQFMPFVELSKWNGWCLMSYLNWIFGFLRLSIKFRLHSYNTTYENAYYVFPTIDTMVILISYKIHRYICLLPFTD